MWHQARGCIKRRGDHARGLWTLWALWSRGCCFRAATTETSKVGVGCDPLPSVAADAQGKTAADADRTRAARWNSKKRTRTGRGQRPPAALDTTESFWLLWGPGAHAVSHDDGGCLRTWVVAAAPPAVGCGSFALICCTMTGKPG
eukprot:gene17547-biopygen23356